MTEQILRTIERGKPISVISKLVKAEFEKQDKENWTKQKGREYDSIFYTQEVAVEAVLDEEATIEYEYITDCPTFDEWLNSTNTVLDGTVTKTDDEGTEYEEEIFIEVPNHVYTPNDATDLVNAYIKETMTPTVVTMRQARLALLDIGMLDVVQGAIEQSGDQSMKVEWEYAIEVRRDWNSLIAMTESMGMTSDELDDIFILAGTK